MKRWHLHLLLGYSVFMCGVCIHRASHLFSEPLPAHFATDHHWLDESLHALLFGIVAGACIAYEYRRAWNRTGPTPRWGDRRELRFVLYSFAVIQFIGIPLAVFEAFQASTDRSTPVVTGFWEAFSPDCFVFAAIGIALIAYDRRRLRQESRLDANQCLRCGYDLRATPDRCPECGHEKFSA